jgi:hypothetical protein
MVTQALPSSNSNGCAFSADWGGNVRKRLPTVVTTAVLNAVSDGYSFGFDIIDVTGLPAGTVSTLDARWRTRSRQPRPSDV